MGSSTREGDYVRGRGVGGLLGFEDVIRNAQDIDLPA